GRARRRARAQRLRRAVDDDGSQPASSRLERNVAHTRTEGNRGLHTRAEVAADREVDASVEVHRIGDGEAVGFIDEQLREAVGGELRWLFAFDELRRRCPTASVGGEPLQPGAPVEAAAADRAAAYFLRILEREQQLAGR